MNVVLVTVDSLRADFVDRNSERLVHTPFLDTVARENVNFVNCYATSPMLRESVPSLISGEYPVKAVDRIHRFREESVAERLGEGVETAAFHGNSYLSEAYGYGDGFDTFFDRSKTSSKTLTRLQRVWRWFRGKRDPSADDITERSVDWLEGLDDNQDFFLWNHYSGLEGPLTPPDKYQDYLFGTPIPEDECRELYMDALKGELDEEGQDKLLKLYKSGVRYMDARLDEFFQRLNDLNLLDDTLVIITSTNGISLGENGAWGHPQELDKECLKVPMIVGGGEASKNHVEAPVSTLDVVPTILNVFDVSDFNKPGENLIDVKQEEGSYKDRKVFAEVRQEDLEKVSFSMYDEELIDTAEVHEPTKKVKDGEQKEQELISHIGDVLAASGEEESDEENEE